MDAHLLIGAASSGSGKTTFTLGLLRALCRRGLKVQPFKCGPDYIDPIHHRMAAGRPSINLDAFMMSGDYLADIYRRYTADADVGLTEGVMGLFDGYDGVLGSSAEMAGLLRIPVILVVNARSAAYSIAPLLYGFCRFDRRIRPVGVVFNFVASESHYATLRQAAEDAGIEPLGYLPRQADIKIPSRYLGLSLDEGLAFDAFAERIASLVERHVNIDRMLELTAAKRLVTSHLPLTPSVAPRLQRIAVAQDAAFNFTYEENIRFFRRMARETVFFSPLNDTSLPEADFVYLPGGYPELHLPALSQNAEMLESMRMYVNRGGKMLAECGGMMYLARTITGNSGKVYPMARVLNLDVTMEKGRLHLGYRRLHFEGHVISGHEFHYSSICPRQPAPRPVARAFNAKGHLVETLLYRYKNLLAGYTHLYWADETQNEWFVRFLNGANDGKEAHEPTQHP
jgi:cobyrinic acid a,c-diamide synthase